MLEYVTPGFKRSVPRTVSALLPSAPYVAAPPLRVSVSFPYVRPDAAMLYVPVPGTSYSNSPLSVPAATDRSGATPAVLRSVPCT